MTAKSSEHLAQVLESVGLHDMATLARLDHYHDFKSDLALPEMELEADLRRARDQCPDAERRYKIEAVRLRHVQDGEFDASKDESDEWAASPDGQAAFNKLIRGG